MNISDDITEVDSLVMILVWAIGGYVVFVPSLSFIPSVIPYNEKRLLQIGLLVFGTLIMLGSRSTRQRWLSTFYGLPQAARWGMGAVLALGLLSSLGAPAPFYAFLEVAHFVLLFVLAGVVASAVRFAPKRTERILLGAVVISTVLYAVYFAVGYGMHLALPDIKLWPDGSTNFANIRFFNHYQTWTLPLLAGALLALPRRRWVGRGAVFGLIVLWWALVFASSVRGTIVAMIVAAAGVGLLFRRRAMKWLGIQGIGLLAGLALYYLLFASGTAPPVTDKFGEAGEYSKRLQQWGRCLEMAWAHPWLGVGPMHFSWPPYHFAKPAHPHNVFMQWLAEWGVLSTFLMSGLTVWGGWSWMQQEQDRAESASAVSNGVRVALVAAVLAGAVHALVSGLVVTPLSQVFLMGIGGWAWGRSHSENRSPKLNFPVRFHAILGVVLVVSIVFVGGSLKDLYNAESRRFAFLEAVEREALSPRYWQQGYLNVRDASVIERACRDR